MPQTNLQPIIVITLYRRYYEFVNSVENTYKLRGEFTLAPIIIVVWADPEPDKFGLIERFLKEGKIHYVLERRKSEWDGWGRPTTPAELLNFKVGFDFIKERFKDFYIILQGADILVKEGIYGWVNSEITKWPAILLFWRNSLETQNAWHTNFWVVKNLKYLPRYNEKYQVDTLETMWAKTLRDDGLNDFLHSHNSRNLKFQEVHSSTKDTIFPQDFGSGVFLFKDGVFVWSRWLYYKSLIKKVLKWLRLI